MNTKNRIWFCALLVIGLTVTITNSCKREKPVGLPDLSTSPLTNITSSSAISGGSVNSDGGEIVSARGVCWSKNPNPSVSDNITSDGEGAGSFLSSLTGLTSGTQYYVRAYATNGVGTAYGNEFIFVLPLSDIDGNIYNTIVIGTQVWMTVNLKTTKYSDNTVIPMVTDNILWGSLTTPAYCWYKNDQNFNKNNYGALYNWYSVTTGKLCPVGWHVPSETEWRILTDYLGGESIASGRLKETGLAHWISPNSGASNEFGFTARPGGYRTGLSSGTFRTLGFYGWWWASTEENSISARVRLLAYDASEVASGTGIKKNGYSVRCIKD